MNFTRQTAIYKTQPNKQLVGFVVSKNIEKRSDLGELSTRELQDATTPWSDPIKDIHRALSLSGGNRIIGITSQTAREILKSIFDCDNVVFVDREEK